MPPRRTARKDRSSYTRWTFRIFFSPQGGGKGSPRRREGGDRFFIENPRRGGGSPGQEGPRGRESVCSDLGNFDGGEAKYFFRRRNVHQVYMQSSHIAMLSMRYPSAGPKRGCINVGGLETRRKAAGKRHLPSNFNTSSNRLQKNIRRLVTQTCLCDTACDILRDHLENARVTPPPPPHTRQTYEQKSGQNMTPNVSKQGKLDSFATMFLFIFLPCMWGLGFQYDSATVVT